MADRVIGSFDRCIYCDSVEGPLSKEHVIAKSLGGKMVIESASCRSCATETGKIEQHLTRETYHLARSFYDLPSRRRRDYPTKMPVTIWYGPYGPKQTVQVPIKDAPVTVAVPFYTPVPEPVHPFHFWSRAAARAHPIDPESRDERVARLMRRYRAHKIEFTTQTLRTGGPFEQVLWKSAYGFFCLCDWPSAVASDARKIILGEQKVYVPDPNSKYSLTQDLSSMPRHETDYPDASATVFTMAEEDHGFIYCELNFFAKVGLPIYICRIPNVSGQQISGVEFFN